MSYDDFCRCTPSQFRLIYDRWNEKEEQTRRSEWERTRQICYSTLQPYLKKRMSVDEFWRFPWDKPKTTGIRKLTMDEEKKEYERIKSEYGIK